MATDSVDGSLPGVYGPVRLPSKSYLVSDADEEVFLLYTDLAGRKPTDGSTSFRGLGHVDSSRDTLTVELTVKAPTLYHSAVKPSSSRTPGRSRKSSKKQLDNRGQERVITIELAQDKTALQSRKGDTGSVVWRASVDFAQTLLQQLFFGETDALLDSTALRDAHVLELGAGTGLLSIALSPFVGRYTVTDVEDLVPLIRKNLASNLPRPPPVPRLSQRTVPPRQGPVKPTNVAVEALDWTALHNASPSTRRAAFSYLAVDLLLVVDCIYHPSLLPSLLSAIDYLTTPGKTAVLVVVELRAEDVVRAFLEGWLNLLSDGEWQIWTIGGYLDGPYAVWFGWKKESNVAKS